MGRVCCPLSASLSPLPAAFRMTCRTRGVGTRAPHHSLENAHSVPVALTRPSPLGLRHVNCRCSRPPGLGRLFFAPVLKRNSRSTSRSPRRGFCRRHVESVSPLLIHEVPECLLGGLPYPVGPFLGPLTPIHGWHSGQYVGQGLVVDQAPEHARLPGPHHGGPEKRVKLADGPTVETACRP